MRRLFPFLLFFLGFLIQLGAFFGDHADEIPWVIRVISPSYYHAEQGLDILDSTGSLATNADGFNEISKILITIVAAGLSDQTQLSATFSVTNPLTPVELSAMYIDNIQEIHGIYGATRNGKTVLDGITHHTTARSLVMGH